MDRFRAIVDVHVLLLRPPEEVLLIRRANTGYRDGQWGHLEPGETVVEGAIREAREEVGVTIEAAGLRFVHVMHRSPDRVGLFFAAGEWAGEPYNAEPHKCSAIGWHLLADLPADTVDYPAAALAAIGRAEPFAVFGWR
ncbi:NUDIX domain-containing protein [Nonomuraea sp. NPDC050394]|uniref:NUDIX hydrolase n=1 Tax=Nonomuraea sp. NPDC050394 TaxID=3364363 RepID=UPI0037BB78A1